MRSFFSSVKNYVNTIVEDADVVDLRGHWLKVQKFYETVQNTTDEGQLAVLQGKLHNIESHLNKIVDHLVREREEFVVSLDDMGTDLPPCYQYLLRRTSTSTAPAAHHADDEIPLSLVGSENDFVIFNICQYAKHDQPAGTRSIMLRTLYRIVTEVDPRRGTMLLVCPDFVAMPLCDALHKVSFVLDPERQHQTATGAGASPARHTPASVSSSALLQMQHDRRHFIALLRALCEKVEQDPRVAVHFTVPSATARGGSSAETSLLLFDKLSAYVYDAVLDLSHSDRFEVFSNVLRGVLSLAKTVGPSVQDVMALRPQVGHAIHDVLRTTFLTVCKIPQNTELRLHTACIIEAVRWIETMMLVAPHVSEAWALRSLFEEEFLRFTVLPIFRTPDERAFLSVTTLLVHMLKDSVTGNTDTANMIAVALLQSRVDHCHHQVFVHRHQLPTDYQETTKVFAEEFLWTRLSDVSDSVVCATLQLISSLAVRAPHLFMQHVLGIDAYRCPLYFSRKFLAEVMAATTTAPSPPQDSPASSPTAGPLRAASCLAPSLTRVSHVVPQITVNDFFPATLQLDRGLCGTNQDDFAQDTLKLILDIESAMSPHEFNAHRVQIEKVQPPAPARDPSSAGAAAAPQVAPPSTKDTETDAYCAGLAAADRDNVFFVASVNDAPFVRALSDVMESMVEHRFSVNALLTELVTALCAQPDLRVCFTLLDPFKGRVAQSIRKVAGRVSEALERDQKNFVNGNSASITRKALFDRCTQRPFFDPSEEAFALDDAVGSLMRTSKVFVEACVCLEGLRHELSCIMCYQVIAQTLSELTGLPQR